MREGVILADMFVASVVQMSVFVEIFTEIVVFVSSGGRYDLGGMRMK